MKTPKKTQPTFNQSHLHDQLPQHIQRPNRKDFIEPVTIEFDRPQTQLYFLNPSHILNHLPF